MNPLFVGPHRLKPATPRYYPTHVVWFSILWILWTRDVIGVCAKRANHMRVSGRACTVPTREDRTCCNVMNETRRAAGYGALEAGDPELCVLQHPFMRSLANYGGDPPT